jgi:hypothetical protein
VSAAIDAGSAGDTPAATVRDAQNSTPEFRRCAIRRARSVCVMKTLTPKAFTSSAFRIAPLPTEVAEEARRVAESGAEDHAIIKVDSATGYPCRHCLRWAQPGERVILFPYASIPPGHPYSETGPIFVHAERCERYGATGEYPVDFRNARVFRAYDANYNMIDARSRMEMIRKQSSRSCSKIRKPNLLMPVALRAVALHFESCAREDWVQKFFARISSMRQRTRPFNLLT